MPRVCITVPGKNAQPYRFSLERKTVRLGRAADNDIIIDCPSVSSRHCEMLRVEGGYILKDLDSTNGIKLDDDRMEVIDLDNGLRVTVGDAGLDFELNEEERKALRAEDHQPQQKAKLPPVSSREEPEELIDGPDDGRGAAPGRQRPAPSRSPVAPPLASAQQMGGGVNFLITVSFLALAALAFWAGLSTKHKTETGGSLWSEVFGSGSAEEPE
jgi:predicted component of type VI protein secretion system